MALQIKDRVKETTTTTGTGAWNAGDIIWNSAPSATGTPGWICTAGGTPGTWTSMAGSTP